MATPLRFKYKWPTEQKKAGTNISDFVPYVSNIANMFARTPNPTAPTLINPVVGSKISLANSRAAIDNEARAADLSTQGLDAQTGAAIRVGNMANRLRALSDVNSREALANAQITNQTNGLNANINAQNAGMINQYHDDLTNAQLTRNRLASENLANAADKYIGQQAVKDQIQLDKDKANIYSKMYTPGVYNRLLGKLQATGTDTAGFGTVPEPRTSPFDQFKNMNLPAYTGPSGAPITASAGAGIMGEMPASTTNSLKAFLQRRRTYAAGGLLDVFGSGDPVKGNMRPTASDSTALYNNANQVLQFYRNKGYSEESGTVPDNVIGALDKYATEYNPSKPRTVPIKGGKAAELPLAKNFYRKDLNPNQFAQREFADNILDTRAPIPLYDRRIQPTKKYRFTNNNPQDPLYGDIVSIYGYDPNVIKPKTPVAGRSIPVTPQQPPVPTEPDLNPTQIQGPLSFRSGIQPAPYQPANTDTRSKFSATYRNPSQPGGQQTIYFPTRDAWQGFLNTGALTGVDTAERDGMASATGYRAFASGGSMRKKKSMGGKMIKPFC
jgi:hypothetical protein